MITTPHDGTAAYANGWHPARPAYTFRTLTLPFGRFRVYVGADAVRTVLPHLRAASDLGVDSETRGLAHRRWYLKAVAVAVDAPGGRIVAVFDPRNPRDAALLRDVLTGNSKQRLVFHNGIYDFPVLVQNRLLGLADVSRVFDTLIPTRLAEPGAPASLDAAAARYFPDMQTSDAWKALSTRWTAEVWFDEADLYRASYLDGVAADAAATLALVDPVLQAARRRLLGAAHGQPFALTDPAAADALIEREMRVLQVCQHRAAAGIPVHLDRLDRFRDEFLPQLDTMIARLEGAGIRHSDPKSMSRWLDSRAICGPEWVRTSIGLPAAQKSLLKPLAKHHPTVAAYLNVRAGLKVAGYLETIEKSHRATGFIHPSFNILAARTGRMSVSDPALQQFPASARGILASPFISGLASTDWTAVEVFLVGAIAQDEVLLAELYAGADPYELVVDAAGVVRKVAKVVILAGIYGQGVPSLARVLGVSYDEARRIRELAFKVMPRVAQYMQTSRDTAASLGQVVTISGRVLPLPVDPQSGFIKSYVATNYAVQGSGYDLMAEAISALHRQGLGDQILMPIHDELVTAADPDVTRAVAEVMRRVPEPLVEHLRGIPFQLFATPEPTGDHWAKPDESEDVELYELPDLDDDETEEGED